jgi:hypothetical protein
MGGTGNGKQKPSRSPVVSLTTARHTCESCHPPGRYFPNVAPRGRHTANASRRSSLSSSPGMLSSSPRISSALGILVNPRVSSRAATSKGSGIPMLY